MVEFNKRIDQSFEVKPMSQVLTTIPAHFDGQQVQFDVDIKLRPNTRLLITILPEEITYEQVLSDAMKVS
jgi:hypothetical protein